MKIKDLVEELEDNEHFKKFKSENSEAYLCAGFFVLNLEEKSEQIQLDYFIPKENKIAAFEFPFGEPKIHEELISVPSQNNKQNRLGQALKDGVTTGKEIEALKEQGVDLKIDIDDLGSVSKETILENDGKIRPTKIIAILKENVWNLTCMDNVLGMVRIKINAISGEVIDYSKGSLMDFMGVRKK